MKAKENQNKKRKNLKMNSKIIKMKFDECELGTLQK